MKFLRKMWANEAVLKFRRSNGPEFLLFSALAGVVVVLCILSYRLGKSRAELEHTPSVMQYTVQQVYNSNPYFVLGRKSSFNHVARLMEEMNKKLNADNEVMKFIIFGMSDTEDDQRQKITIIITTTSDKQLKGIIKGHGHDLNEGAMVITYIKPGERYY